MTRMNDVTEREFITAHRQYVEHGPERFVAMAETIIGHIEIEPDTMRFDIEIADDVPPDLQRYAQAMVAVLIATDWFQLRTRH